MYTQEEIDKMKTENRCQHCNSEEAQEPHTCPFAEEMQGDNENLCNCCSLCTNNCLMDI